MHLQPLPFFKILRCVSLYVGSPLVEIIYSVLLAPQLQQLQLHQFVRLRPISLTPKIWRVTVEKARFNRNPHNLHVCFHCVQRQKTPDDQTQQGINGKCEQYWRGLKNGPTHTKTQQLGLRDLSFPKRLGSETLEPSESYRVAVVMDPEAKSAPSPRSSTGQVAEDVKTDAEHMW